MHIINIIFSCDIAQLMFRVMWQTRPDVTKKAKLLLVKETVSECTSAYYYYSNKNVVMNDLSLVP